MSGAARRGVSLARRFEGSAALSWSPPKGSGPVLSLGEATGEGYQARTSSRATVMRRSSSGKHAAAHSRCRRHLRPNQLHGSAGGVGRERTIDLVGDGAHEEPSLA